LVFSGLTDLALGIAFQVLKLERLHNPSRIHPNNTSWVDGTPIAYTLNEIFLDSASDELLHNKEGI